MAPCKSMEESDSDMRKRLVDSLSQSFPGSALSKALHTMTMNDEEQEDPLSTSCFAQLRLDKGPLDEEDDGFDDELTSLSWLHDTNLLKNIDTGDSRLCESPTDELSRENNENSFEINGVTHHQGHPTNVPYNPRKHINSKPPYSFSCLIFMAIEDSPFKRLPVKDIYAWIVNHFPYFQNAPTGWKNSVRHNLSLNKCFKKVDKEKGQSIGKGSLWCIDPDYRPNLLQALRKTPYHPYHQLQMLASPQPMTPLYQNQKTPLAPKINFNISPHLFPFLSRRLQTPNGSDLELDIDVANTLMSLKGSSPKGYNNPRLKPLSLQYDSPNGDRYRKKLRHSPYIKKRPTSPIIITSSPSEDHTYSASSSPFEAGGQSPASNSSSIDEEYDFGPESDSEEEFDESEWEEDVDSDDEKKKIVEGADALLNLAGITSSSLVPMRAISPLINNNNIKQEIKQEICA